MPKISEFFADAKITPTDRGTAAFEQAGRRIAGFYQQIAEGDRQLGRDIGDLWNEAKFGIDLSEARQRELQSRGGEGGFRSARGGGADNLFRMGADRGANGPNGNPNLPNEYSRSYNARAARDIGRGAAGLPGIINKIINGQGLTDQERMAYERSAYAQRHPGGSFINTNPKTGGIAPNADPNFGLDQNGNWVPLDSKGNIDTTGEELTKSGFNVDQTVGYGQSVPTYPPTPAPGLLDRAGSAASDALSTAADVSGAVDQTFLQGGDAIWTGINKVLDIAGGLVSPSSDNGPSATGTIPPADTDQ